MAASTWSPSPGLPRGGGCRSTLAAPPPTPGGLNLREEEGGATDSRRTDTRVSRQDYHLLTYNSGKGNVSGEVWVRTQQPVSYLVRWRTELHCGTVGGGREEGGKNS